MRTLALLTALCLATSIPTADAYPQSVGTDAIPAPANEFVLACYLSRIDPSKYRAQRNLNEITTGDYFLLGIGLSPWSDSPGDLTVRIYDPNGLIDAKVDEAKKTNGLDLAVVKFRGGKSVGQLLTLTKNPAISNNYVGLLIPQAKEATQPGYTGMCGDGFPLTRTTSFDSLRDLKPSVRRNS